MDKLELINAFKSMRGDQEIDHSRADDMLLDYIGDDDIRKAFNDIPKWYA